MEIINIGLALNFSLLIINFIVIIGVLLHYREFSKRAEAVLKLFNQLKSNRIKWIRSK